MGRLIKIIDHVSQCYSNADGEIIQILLRERLRSGLKTSLSFAGIDGASSSFINSALIELLDEFSFDFIKSHLSFTDTTKTINETIKKRFSFEVNERKKLISV
ncbi:STAS-like domain-containing protein [Cohnella abietis]|uniref:DUF4325 domain-containing protein n=1 Tax=Cohnella abietis TaxID=2507935 RepID=A0A3T1D3J4_9BACL|nr:DUF4325 domain-containing protein [Cohnella abietis]BBI32664.1 hypothetical protein KCTCHS21_20630 [Cohnella abietis]